MVYLSFLLAFVVMGLCIFDFFYSKIKREKIPVFPLIIGFLTSLVWIIGLIKFYF